jgi:PTH2 family peptidyl-tRNA hydrolase
MYKLSVIVRDDLKLGKGKLCAQASHAVLECFMKQKDIKLIKSWLNEGGKKVVLKVKTLKDLLAITEKAKRAGLVTALIQDAGLTEVKPGTVTCVGIGPDREDRIDKITNKLETL